MTHEDEWESGDTIESIPTSSLIIEFHINLKTYLKDTVEHFEFTTNFVEIDFLLPFISLAPGGTVNIVVGGKHNGKIYELDNGDFGILFISSTLEEFINTL